MQSKIPKDKYPMIWELVYDRKGIIVSERELSIEDDLYLDHHRFNNVPFLPGVFGFRKPLCQTNHKTRDKGGVFLR